MNASWSWETHVNWLLNHSLQAGLLVLLVLWVQWIFRRQLTSRWRFALWWIVLARLLLPVTPESGLSIFNFFQPKLQLSGPRSTTPQWPEAKLEPRSPVSVPEQPAPGRWPESPHEEFSKNLVNPRPSPEPLLLNPLPSPAVNRRLPLEPRPTLPHSWSGEEFLIPGLVALWSLGVLSLSTMVLVQIIRFRRKLARSRVPVDQELQALFQACQRDFDLLTSIELIETDAVQSPALFGFWRLTLLLPRGVSGQFTRSELRYIFLHEIAHVQRGDLWVNWLVTGLQFMHWFNPLIWFGFARLRADRELACDELALLRAGDLSGTAYGETVLKLLENLRPAAGIPGLIGILEDRKQMHRRISMIANFRRPGRWSVLAVLLVTAVAAVALTDAPAAAPNRYETAPILNSPRAPLKAEGGSDLIPTTHHLTSVPSKSHLPEWLDTTPWPDPRSSELPEKTWELPGILNFESPNVWSRVRERDLISEDAFLTYHLPVTSSGSTNFAFVANRNRHRSGRKSKRIPPAIVRWHFRGLQFLETQTVAPTIARVASMPEAEAVGLRLATRLTEALVQRLNLPHGPALTPGLIPLASDLLRYESAGEVTDHGWRVTVHLPADHASVWRKKVDSLVELRPTRSPVSMGLTDGWLSLSSGGTDEGDWIPLLPGSFLNIDGDGSVFFSGSSEDSPRFQLTAELATNQVMTHATFDFMTPPLGPLPEWRLPEKMASAPFTQFTAFRGGKSWLDRQGWWREIFGKETPDQVFAWSTADGQLCSWLAMPVADPRGKLERIFSTLEPHFGTNGFLTGRLELATNHEAVAVLNPLGIKPVIAHVRQGDQDFLLGALFPGGASTHPIPRGLLATLAEQNLVYQDVEFTPESIQHWNAIFQCYQVMKGHPVNAPKAEAHSWMWSGQSEFGDAVTAVHRVSPTRFTLERSSTIGFTGLELVLATRWLDGPIKPVLVSRSPKP